MKTLYCVGERASFNTSVLKMRLFVLVFFVEREFYIGGINRRKVDVATIVGNVSPTYKSISISVQ